MGGWNIAREKGNSMIDREKVIKGLECCAKNTCAGEGCPYFGDDCDALKQDALELLKAEKKTKVVFKQYDGSIESECGNCGLYLDKTYSRCPKCNKELDWNGG